MSKWGKRTDNREDKTQVRLACIVALLPGILNEHVRDGSHESADTSRILVINFNHQRVLKMPFLGSPAEDESSLQRDALSGSRFAVKACVPDRPKVLITRWQNAFERPPHGSAETMY